MLTKIVRSRFNHEIGEKVEGCTILEKTVIAPPKPAEMRRGIYDYLVEVPPLPEKTRAPRKSETTRRPAASAEEPSFTRATPEEMGGGRIRRVPSR